MTTGVTDDDRRPRRLACRRRIRSTRLSADELRRSRGVIDAAGLLRRGDTLRARPAARAGQGRRAGVGCRARPLDRQVLLGAARHRHGRGDRGRRLARRRAGAATRRSCRRRPIPYGQPGSGRRRAGHAGRDRQGRRPVAGGDAPSRRHRPHAVQGAAAVGRAVRVPRRGRTPGDARHHALPGGADRHPVDAPHRGRHRLRRPRSSGASSHFADHGGDPIPPRQPNLAEGAWGPVRTCLRPLAITQPDGPSFQVDGDAVEWEGWSFRIGFDAREGLVLHQLGYADGDRVRPILHRASVSEMVVPYADPHPMRFWISYFDEGEYGLGRLASTLTLGCDCLGEIHYFDAVYADDQGQPVELPQGRVPARGGRRRAVEAPGLLQRHQRGAPIPPPRRVVVGGDRQLRLRLLLVPLPGRHDRVRHQAHRASCSPSPPTCAGDHAARGHAGAERARTTSTCSTCAST